jgi:hypothetical protein
MRAYCRTWRHQNPERRRLIDQRKYTKACRLQPERMREASRKAHKRYYVKNTEKERRRCAAWAKANREICREQSARWRSRGKAATPKWLKASGQHTDIRAFYKNAPAGMHVDHDIPLAGCRRCGAFGLHVLANLQYLPAAVNDAKGNRCTACFLAED